MAVFIASDPFTNPVFDNTGVRLPIIYIQAQACKGSSGSPVFLSYHDGYYDNKGVYHGKIRKEKLLGINSTRLLDLLTPDKPTFINSLEFMVVWKAENIKNWFWKWIKP